MLKLKKDLNTAEAPVPVKASVLVEEHREGLERLVDGLVVLVEKRQD